MANIKSAKKRIKVNQTKALRNKMVKSGVKTAIQHFFPLPARSTRPLRRVFITRIPLPEKFPDLLLQSTRWLNCLTLIEI